MLRRVLLLLLLVPVLACADEVPVWEVGAGLGWVDFPKYRGSDERRVWLLPVPYFTYQGKFLKVSRQSARGLLFRRDWVEMDVSFNGSPPSASKDTQSRIGMPDLDATFEVGPQVMFHLYYDTRKETNIDLRLPVRPAIATNFMHFQHIGWLFQPRLNLDLKHLVESGWNMGLSTGPIYSDRRYNQYFYAVDAQYATATRPMFSAAGGYGGYQFTVALSKRFPRFWTGGFVKWDDLSGAVFARSPLVRTARYVTYGWAISWVLDRSDETVEVTND